MGIWGKATNYEISTRVPLIAWTPKMKGGKSTDALVELLDIYPSLGELAGLPKPAHLAGESFVPLLDDPKTKMEKACDQSVSQPCPS